LENVKTAALLQAIIPHFHRILRSERTEFLKGFRISPAQYDVLVSLERGSLNLSAISDALQLDSSTLVGIVDRLERQGLVRKKVSPSDRRKNIISITDQGKRTLEQVPPFVSPSLLSVLCDLDTAQQKELTRLLFLITGKLDDKDFVAPVPDTERNRIAAVL